LQKEIHLLKRLLSSFAKHAEARKVEQTIMERISKNNVICAYQWQLWEVQGKVLM
jgi:hypothetical protein